MWEYGLWTTDCPGSWGNWSSLVVRILLLLVFAWPFVTFALVVACYALVFWYALRDWITYAVLMGIGGTWLLALGIGLVEGRPEWREAERERSFRAEFVAPLPSGAGELYDEIIAASGVGLEVKKWAKTLVQTPSLIEHGFPRELAKSFIEENCPNSDYRLKQLANAIVNVIDQMPPSD